MEGTIAIRDGRFAYGTHEVFREISFEVRPGQILSLLGPNGCGKTTLLRCIAGSLRLSEGTVLLGNQDTARFSVNELARKVAFVFQEHTVIFPFSVLELVCMGRTPYLGLFESPSAEDEQIAADALKSVGLFHLKDKPYSQISGGERQLALIARALTQQPRTLLLDEPTSHLDFGNQVLLLRIIRRLVRDQGLSVIMATHFPNHAMLVSSHVALMKKGRIMPPAPPENLITETNLKSLYGVGVKVVSLEGRKSPGSRVVIPIMDEDDE